MNFDERRKRWVEIFKWTNNMGCSQMPDISYETCAQNNTEKDPTAIMLQEAKLWQDWNLRKLLSDCEWFGYIKLHLTFCQLLRF